MKTIFGRTEENWYLPELKQDTLVEFDMGGFKGTGKIVGIASMSVPVLGRTYIIEMNQPILVPAAYDYTHIACAEICLNPIDLTKLCSMGNFPELDIKTNNNDNDIDIDIDEKYTTGHRI